MSPTPEIRQTQRDREVLSVAGNVRVVSVDQIAERFWTTASDPAKAARQRLVRLSASGHLRLIELSACPLLPTLEPLATWQPGLAAPDFAATVLPALRRRYEAGSVKTTCAMRRTTGFQPPRETDGTHDLYIAAVYLNMLRELPTRARSWVFENEIQPWSDYHPDALVVDGRSKTMIEIGGQYDRARLEKDHAACAERGYGYEIW